jgi:uncharacterized protein with GYD domain
VTRTRQEAQREYEELKQFFSFYSDRYLNIEGLAPESRPAACLETLEKMGMKMASNGLRQAINDCVVMSYELDHKEVAKLDDQLRSRGIITLSELRRRYSKNYAKIMKQRQITNDTEYYLLRNVLDDPTAKTAEERELLENLIANYEGT